MKKSTVTKKTGGSFELVRTEVAVMDRQGLEAHRANLMASLAHCQAQKKHLEEWEQAILDEVQQIDGLLGGKPTA